MTAEEALRQAEAEGLTLLRADNTTSFKGVSRNIGRGPPYKARVWRGGTDVYLGYFTTAEEAALMYARSQAAVAAAAAPPAPLAGHKRGRGVAHCIAKRVCNVAACAAMVAVMVQPQVAPVGLGAVVLEGMLPPQPRPQLMLPPPPDLLTDDSGWSTGPAAGIGTFFGTLAAWLVQSSLVRRAYVPL